MINLVSICVLVTMVAMCSGSAIPMWEYLGRDEKVSQQRNAIKLKQINEGEEKKNRSGAFHRNAIIYLCQLLCCGGVGSFREHFCCIFYRAHDFLR